MSLETIFALLSPCHQNQRDTAIYLHRIHRAAIAKLAGRKRLHVSVEGLIVWSKYCDCVLCHFDYISIGTAGRNETSAH